MVVILQEALDLVNWKMRELKEKEEEEEEAEGREQREKGRGGLEA